MIKALAVLLLFQCLGETISFIGKIPVPGAVIGMLLLLGAFRLSKDITSIVEEPALAFLKHLSLLFVPAGAGIVIYAGKVESDLLPIAVTILLGTALTVCMTAVTAEALHKLISNGAAVSPAENGLPATTASNE
ncbi:CidA/LrgA family protein [Caballeronia grimmiae]|uniref:CidA/LrgA family protein n=1 Tax=Caballeronia grimmiae TaxID=1071679 RepID=UPI0038B882FB